MSTEEASIFVGMYESKDKAVSVATNFAFETKKFIKKKEHETKKTNYEIKVYWLKITRFGFFKNKLIKFACKTIPICIVNLVGYSKCTFGENYQV